MDQQSTGIVVTGASGRMGRMLVREVLATDGCRLVGAVEREGSDWVGQDVGTAMGGAAVCVTVTDDPVEVEQPVDDLEPGGLVAPHGRGVADVARLALVRRVLEHHVRRLEHADRQWVRAVLANRFQEAMQERCAHDLELERLGVRDPDRGLPVIFAVQPLEVFFM